jgi:ribosome-binding factor A
VRVGRIPLAEEFTTQCLETASERGRRECPAPPLQIAHVAQKRTRLALRYLNEPRSTRSALRYGGVARGVSFSDIVVGFTQEVYVEKRGAKYHRERLGEALREEIETIVEGELGDPRIGLVSVTSVVLAEDSRSAQVFVTLDGDDAEADRSLEGLTAAVGFIRREVAENLHLRRPPELYFHLDRSDKYGARIDELLGRTKKRKK